MKGLTIKNKLIIAFLVVLIIPTVLVGWFSYNSSYDEVERVILDSAETSVNQLDNSIDDLFGPIFAQVEEYATEIDSTMYDEEYEEQILDDLNQYRGLFTTIKDAFVATNEGQVVIHDDVPEDFDPRERDWYVRAMDHPGEVVVSEPYEGANSAETLVTVSTMVSDGSGVLGFDLNMEELEGAVNTISIGEEGLPFLLTEENNYVINPSEDIENGSSAEGYWVETVNASSEGVFQYEFLGDPWQMFHVTNNTTGWTVAGSMYMGEVDEAASPILTTSLTVITVSLLIGLGFMMILIRSIINPLNYIVKASERVSEGDLTEKIEYDKNDELGRLSTSFNEMVNSLKTILSGVSEKSETISSSSEELSASSEQNTQASEQISNVIQNVSEQADLQSEKVNSSVRIISEMSEGIQQIAHSSQAVSKTSENAADSVSQGNEAIKTTMNQMDAINQKVNHLSNFINDLSQRAEEIDGIIQEITNISEQTNLLALNAAIEAARAGEHGKGFAVVADEVRKLAEQSSGSTEKVRGLISSIQEGTQNAVQSMNESNEAVSEGIEVVNQADQSFTDIQEFVEDVAVQIQEVTASSEQLSSNADEVVNAVNAIKEGVEETNSGVREISSSTQEQLASMEEISSSSSSLSKLAEELQESVNQFKV
ncbi:methyl-accepting chemotaxis protein [Texcoconibacillus texcoconensis]|uniref:Methyl-accepting chemotaxis protein n=1 Tax=Texcoconibacillus texcoconensis TaxID=1095777 RepID=A0A840QME9_9BACI|nr:methyl-accepting chemotaxis protein [Texcoconibacillus texcoconensis]MBB5172523.1 methyl-accepting chemotaxis protein [Texcoconibacillus texcoconensis]